MTLLPLTENRRSLLVDAVMEFGQYFEVLILGIAFDEHDGVPVMIIDMECERGARSASFALDMGAGLSTARAIIRRVIGDWTL